VTHADQAQRLATDIATNANVVSKTQAEYNIPEPVPADKQDILRRDAEWKAYRLNVPRDRITIVPVDQMFEK
jgi:hypothetical protein